MSLMFEDGSSGIVGSGWEEDVQMTRGRSVGGGSV